MTEPRPDHAESAAETVSWDSGDLLPPPPPTDVRPPLGWAASTVVSPHGPTDPVPPEVPGYDILGVLGRGAMGVVYRARQHRPRREVALKMILTSHFAGPEVRRRFLNEAEAIARLQHPHIVQIYELGEADGHPFYSMELIEGTTLAERFRDRLPDRLEAITLIESLAQALEHAHRAGIVHRDVKPANVLLTADSTPKLTDFGLARQDITGSLQTADGTQLGTPAYMSPEQAAGKSHLADGRADVWSLGVMLYELLTGELPFQGTTIALLQAVQTVDPPPPSRLRHGISQDLETICLKCLQKDPARRYQSAAALAEDLRRFRESKPIIARRTGRVVRSMKWVRRHPVRAGMWMMGLVAVLALLAGAWYFDAYHRKYVEYYRALAFRWGVPVGLGQLEPEEVARRAETYELTQYGRLNPPSTLRVVNGRFEDADGGRLVSWIDAFSSSESPLQWTRNEYIYNSQGRLDRELAFDADGRPVYELWFTDESADAGLEPGRKVTIRYVNKGFDLELPTEVAVIRLERDAAGYDCRALFFDGNRQPRPNPLGIYGYELTNNAHGQPTSMVYLAANGRTPLTNRLGYAGIRVIYDSWWREIENVYCDEMRNPVCGPDGYAYLITEYGPAGNIQCWKCLGPNREPVLNSRLEASTLTFEYGNFGEVETIVRKDLDGKVVGTASLRN